MSFPENIFTVGATTPVAATNHFVEVSMDTTDADEIVSWLSSLSSVNTGTSTITNISSVASVTQVGMGTGGTSASDASDIPAFLVPVGQDDFDVAVRVGIAASKSLDHGGLFLGELADNGGDETKSRYMLAGRTSGGATGYPATRSRGPSQPYSSYTPFGLGHHDAYTTHEWLRIRRVSGVVELLWSGQTDPPVDGTETVIDGAWHTTEDWSRGSVDAGGVVYETALPSSNIAMVMAPYTATGVVFEIAAVKATYTDHQGKL